MIIVPHNIVLEVTGKQCNIRVQFVLTSRASVMSENLSFSRGSCGLNFLSAAAGTVRVDTAETRARNTVAMKF